MIDRRTLIALGMAAPTVKTSFRLDLPDPRIHPLNTGGIHVFGISPDASLLVGIREREALCILDAKTRETLAESDPIPELSLLDEQSVRWSPDGTRIAFSLSPWIQLRDSDIFVMDVSSGELTNLTPEGNDKEAHSLMDEQSANVDVNPVWLDDDTLVFARHRYEKDQDIQISLTTMSLADESTDAWIDLSAADVMYVTSPIWKRSDGTLVFGTDSRKNDQNVNSAMIVSPDGTIEEIELGEHGSVRVLDVNDTHLIAIDQAAFTYLYVPLDSSSDGADLWDHFKLPETYAVRSDATFGSDPNTILLMAEQGEDRMFIMQVSESEATEIAELYHASGPVSIVWAQDVILVTSNNAAWLINAPTRK